MLTIRMPADANRTIFSKAAGPHWVHVELPDIMLIQLNGDVEAEHFQVFYGALVHYPEPTMVYILRDSRNGGVVSQRARKYVAENINVDRVASIVTFGSSFHARTVFTMLSKAMRLFNKRVPPATFFDTEAEARAWIAADRRNTKSKE